MTAEEKVEFNDDSTEYYPPACCEMLHVTNAVYLATTLQIVFVVTLSIFYYSLERNSFINAVEIFRPAVVFVVCVNVIGIICALVGVLLQHELLITAQISLLAGLVVISDLVAFILVAIMAFGSRTYKRTLSSTNHSASLPAYFVDEKRFEAVLGPFWIYLTAIVFHMCAAAIMCIIGIHRRYGRFLKDKFSYSRVHEMARPAVTNGFGGLRNGMI
ncbi:hypothetical protein Ddc_07321 [Ditylenchus destructor]|nr:hypothetical protein Ddc_07321 [Ditylenchus destructor]